MPRANIAATFRSPSNICEPKRARHGGDQADNLHFGGKSVHGVNQTLEENRKRPPLNADPTDGLTTVGLPSSLWNKWGKTMLKLLRMTALTATAAAIALAATPAAAAPTGPSDRNATATARIVKPLTLAWSQDLLLGTVLMTGAGTWSGAVVSLPYNATAVTCTNANVVCSGAVQVAKYTVTGTNNQRVYITAPNFSLTNANDGSTLPFVVDKGPGYLDLANSGNSGVEFALGGAISIASTTTDGTYSGTFNVTVDY